MGRMYTPAESCTRESPSGKLRAGLELSIISGQYPYRLTPQTSDYSTEFHTACLKQPGTWGIAHERRICPCRYLVSRAMNDIGVAGATLP
jgi:hypothetical protein